MRKNIKKCSRLPFLYRRGQLLRTLQWPHWMILDSSRSGMVVAQYHWPRSYPGTSPYGGREGMLCRPLMGWQYFAQVVAHSQNVGDPMLRRNEQRQQPHKCDIRNGNAGHYKILIYKIK